MTRLHLSEEFHQEDIEFNASIFSPVVSMLVINQLHRSSSTILLLVRFFEHVSVTTNSSQIYLRLLQSSFGAYFSSVSTQNSDYQQRWSAFVHFQLPRIFASCLNTHFDRVREAMESFLLHNEFLLNRIDELCRENVFATFAQMTLEYTEKEVREKNAHSIDQLIHYIQQTRQGYVQQIQEHSLHHSTRRFFHISLSLFIHSLLIQIRIFSMFFKRNDRLRSR